MTKKVDASAHIGDSAISLIHTRVNEMGYVWHERKIDAGIDGSIELRNPASGEVNNRHLFVQSKGRNARFSGETERGFHFICKPDDVDYWMSSDTPVILICSHPPTGEAWWAHVQGCLADPSRRATGRIDFDKATQRFDAAAASRLLALADPHGQAHVPVPIAREEVLTSNLLLVDFPRSAYGSPCRVRDPSEIFRAMRGAAGPTRHDWVLRGGRLYTWEPAEHSVLRAVVDGPSELVDLITWENGEDEDQRTLVALLNNTFRHDQAGDCGWTPDRRTIYFRATPNLRERRILSGSGRQKLVFHPKFRKSDKGVSYYMHASLTWSFLQAEGQWYCALVAGHYYTRDGYRESDFAGDLQAGLKRLERNPSVYGDVRMWARYLKGEEDLLGPRGTRLTYGDLLSFTVEQGIDDKEWLADNRSGVVGVANSNGVGAVSGDDAERVEVVNADDDLRLFG